MSLRQKLLLIFSLTVAAAVAVVAWTVLVRIRQVFESRDQQETALFVSQFQREFQHRGTEVALTLDRLAASERARAMALELMQSGDSAQYVNDAQSLAQEGQLDFLEVVGADGNVISSAQWPARFGYPEPAAASSDRTPFLKQEDLPDGTKALGLFAVRSVGGPGTNIHLVGGTKLDRGFLNDLPIAPGMLIELFSDPGPNGSTGFSTSSGTVTGAATPSFDPALVNAAGGAPPDAAHYQSLIDLARRNGQPVSGIVDTTGRREDSLNATAIPLKGENGQVLAVLTIALSRSGMVSAQQHIRTTAYGVAAVGILLAIIFSLWITARVSRPIEQLAHAAEDVAAGNWNVRVPEQGRDEVSVLARSFNHMTEELVGQRERLVQTERVAAWRELARRLAHELKNPLFPLQLTVENLTRARELPAAEFDEVFRESTTTLTAEIANLKKIIGRFSDFSKMPKPELERIDAKDVVERVRALYTKAAEDANIRFELNLPAVPLPLMADPELLHRALSNLALNALDAMPGGGTLTIRAEAAGNSIEIRVSDTGEGLTPEECERLFTPYYTTKQHGTGLGLAIVQSIVADHAGAIAVESSPGRGATFIITLPKAGA